MLVIEIVAAGAIAVMATAPPLIAQEIPGGHSTSEVVSAVRLQHADLPTTQRYMHLSPAATEDAIRLLDGRLVDLKVAQSVET